MTELIYKCDMCKKQLDTQEIEMKIKPKDIPEAHFCGKCAEKVKAMMGKLIEKGLADVSEVPKRKRPGRPKKKTDTQLPPGLKEKVMKLPPGTYVNLETKEAKEVPIEKKRVFIEPLEDVSEIDFSDGVDAEISELARELARGD